MYSVSLIQVINADSLLVPVMEKANEIALSEAKEKVKEEVLARLTIEQNSKKGTTVNMCICTCTCTYTCALSLVDHCKGCPIIIVLVGPIITVLVGLSLLCNG